MKTLTRGFLALAILAAFGLLTGCGGSNGTTPVGVPISISLSPSSTNINQGQTSTITAAVANDATNAGVTWSASAQGCPSNSCLTNVTPTSVTYNAPASFIGPPFTASITATSKADTSVTSAVQITVTGEGVSVTANPSTITAGQASNLSATVTNLSSPNVTWSLSPNFGTLGSETGTTAVYTAPTTVTTSTKVTITATSTVNKSVSGPATITVNPAGTGSNVADIIVDGGPVAGQIYVNGAFATVTICQPGSSTNCVTVDHLLVDTGSYGLRVLQTELNGLTLTPITSSGLTLNDCAQFVDGSFLWGEVASADVHIAGETASNIPIHVVADPSGGIGNIPAGTNGCNNGGTDEDNQTALGANGILGVGPEPLDCELAGVNYCDGSQGSPAPVYFACPCTSTSQPVVAPDADQVTNPVHAFTTDNNGVVINFPAVGAAAATASGTLTFGINTQSDNTVPSTATVYQMDPNDSFSTTYSGVTSPLSFLDSGSNGYFIPNTAIPACTDYTSFFCPSSNLTNQSATTASNVSSATGIVSFEIDNTDKLFNGNPSDAAFGTLGGPNGSTTCTIVNGQYQGSCSFDWGLPFFYGRTVFTAIDGATVSNQSTPTPWWAY